MSAAHRPTLRTRLKQFFKSKDKPLAAESMTQSGLADLDALRWESAQRELKDLPPVTVDAILKNCSTKIIFAGNAMSEQASRSAIKSDAKE